MPKSLTTGTTVASGTVVGLDQLGFYTLGGHVTDPREMFAELALAQELGLGQAFISERLNVKEACALSGRLARSPTGSASPLRQPTSIPVIQLLPQHSPPLCIDLPVVGSLLASGAVFARRSRRWAWRRPRPPNSKSLPD